MATMVEWVIKSVNRDAVQVLAEYAHCDASELINGVDSSGVPELHIAIFNTPEKDKPCELPPQRRPDSRPGPGTEVRHFAAFYGLYEDPAGKPIPRFKDLGDQFRTKIDGSGEIRGVDYNCIAGVATAEERS